MDRRRLVVGHASAVLLTGVRFIVRESGRQRVIREGRKNVHAFVEGELIDAVALDGYACPSGRGGGAWGIDAREKKRLGPALSYNPRKRGAFIREDLGTPVAGAGGVLLNAAGMSGCYLYD